MEQFCSDALPDATDGSLTGIKVGSPRLVNKSSAASEMGDRLATIDMAEKRGLGPI